MVGFYFLVLDGWGCVLWFRLFYCLFVLLVLLDGVVMGLGRVFMICVFGVVVLCWWV